MLVNLVPDTMNRIINKNIYIITEVISENEKKKSSESISSVIHFATILTLVPI